MANRLYVSFWDLCLDNLPQGRFECRVIGAGDASQMIRAAHTDKTLLCVSKDDLLAPYRTKKRRRHEELCALLRASYDCPLRFENFLTIRRRRDCRREHPAVAGGGVEAGRSLVDRDMQLPTCR